MSPFLNAIIQAANQYIRYDPVSRVKVLILRFGTDLHFSQNYTGGGDDEDEQMADDDEDEDAELDE